MNWLSLRNKFCIENGKLMKTELKTFFIKKTNASGQVESLEFLDYILQSKDVLSVYALFC